MKGVICSDSGIVEHAGTRMSPYRINMGSQGGHSWMTQCDKDFFPRFLNVSKELTTLHVAEAYIRWFTR